MGNTEGNGADLGEVRGDGVTRGVLTHIRPLTPWLIGTLALVGIMGAVILTIHFTTHVDVTLIISDPADKGHLPGYSGLYTFASAFALLAGGAICVFAAQLLRNRPAAFPSALFLLTFGALIGWLGIDDLFMFHEWAGLAIAELLGRGDEPGARSRFEAIVFAAYAVAWIVWLGRFWRTVRQTAFVLLALVLVFFGLSVAIDVGLFLFPGVLPDTAWMPTTVEVAEEMLKLTGTFFAFAYAWQTGIGAVRREMSCPAD